MFRAEADDDHLYDFNIGHHGGGAFSAASRPPMSSA